MKKTACFYDFDDTIQYEEAIKDLCEKVNITKAVFQSLSR